MKYSISSSLANAYLQEQASYAVEQKGLVLKTDTTVVRLQKRTFYVKSLTSMAICNHLLLNNIQLKELNYYKIKMLHLRINEVSQRIEKFKALLKLAVSKFEAGDA